MPDFFISYTRADLAWARWIAQQLTDAGFTVTYQEQDFRPGSNFVLEMQRALVESERVIAVLSPIYLNSRFALAEWAAAFAEDPTGEKGKLVPVRVRECELKGLHLPNIYVNLVGLDENDARAALLTGIKQEPVAATLQSFPGGVVRAPEAPTRFPGLLPPVWNVPHLRNPLFTGRDDLLSALEPAQESVGRAARVSYRALHGLGGIGKTQLAVEAAYRFSTEYDIVWWLRAEDGTALLTDYIALGKALSVAAAEQFDQPAAVEAIRRRLEQGPGRWLIVFDNAVHAAQLQSYLPRGGDGDVLITSRNPEWAGLAESDLLDVLPEAEATEFLLNRTGQEDGGAAAALARELGYLPLALAQAAAYAAATGMTLARYLELFQHHRELLARGDLKPAYPDTVATTWELSFQHVTAQSPVARDLLNLLGFLAPDAIPLSLLTNHGDELPEPLATAIKEVIPLEDAKAQLRRISLVEFVANNALSIHRLVQMVIRDRLPEDERSFWVGVAVRTVDAAFPGHGEDERTWPTCQRLVLHGLAATAAAAALDVEPAATIRLLNHMGGGYLKSTSQLGEARRVLTLALSISERHSEDLPDLLPSTLSNLGSVLGQQGSFDEARQLFERALELDEQAYDPNHERLGSKLNNLAGVLHKQGDLDGSQRNYERALAIAEANYERPDSRIAACLDNLAGVLLDQGNLPGAQAYIVRAMVTDAEIFGDQHATRASHLNSLGTVIRAKGDLSSAEAIYKEALQIAETALGPTHPHVANVLNNLAAVQIDRRRLAGARWHLKRALAITESQLGLDHHEVGQILHNLAVVHAKLRDMATAIDLHQRALRITETVHGMTHPSVGTILKVMAATFRRSGAPDIAKKQCEKALAIWEARDDSERQAEVLAELALVEFDLGNRKEAMDRLAQAITLLQQQPPSALEGGCFSELGRLATDVGYWPEGVLLTATTLSIDKLIGLEEKVSREELRRQFSGLEIDKEGFDNLVIQAEEGYIRDRGQELIRAVVNS